MVKVTVERNDETIVREGDFVYAVIARSDEDGVWTDALLRGELKGIGLGELMAQEFINDLKKVRIEDGGGLLGLVEFINTANEKTKQLKKCLLV